jgi:hypothetical protein
MRFRQAAMMDKGHRLLLRAALGEGAEAAEAYRLWRENVQLDDIEAPAYRLMPLLLRTAEQHGLDDPDIHRMRGIGKHIWLSNFFRARALSTAIQALSKIGIDVLLIKGAALFARDEGLAAVRMTEDYDLLIRRADAGRAFKALVEVGFQSVFGLNVEDLEDADFDRLLHACPFALEPTATGALDIHWKPLPELDDPHYIEEMFNDAEPARLGHVNVKVVSLADHLFLALARADPWEKDEVFFRSIEAAQIIRIGQGSLDWQRLEHLVGRFGYDAYAANILQLIVDELEIDVPDGLIDRLSQRKTFLNQLNFAIASIEPNKRGPLLTFCHKALQVANSERSGNSLVAAISAISRSGPRRQLLKLVKEQLAWEKVNIQDVWNRYAAGPTPGRLSYRQGFSIPERDGRWTDGKVAVLEIPVDRPPDTDVEIRLTVRPFFPPQRSVFRFDALCGTGTSVPVELTVDGGSPVDVILQARAVGRQEGKVVIALHLRDAGRPIDLGLSEDARLLGLFVERIQIHT